MTEVLVLGANGQLARNTIPFLLKKPDVALTLYLRCVHRLRNPDPSRVTIVEGDVLDPGTLRAAMQGQDVVYAGRAPGRSRTASNDSESRICRASFDGEITPVQREPC